MQKKMKERTLRELSLPFLLSFSFSFTFTFTYGKKHFLPLLRLFIL